jgi:hypothetical protein
MFFVSKPGRYGLVLTLWLIAPGLVRAGEDEGPKTVLRVEQIDGRLALIGRLGRELGTIMTLEAEVIDGSIFRAKDLHGVTLLKVVSLGGTSKLREPVYLRFWWYDGRDTSAMKGRITITGFETGAFTGLPAEAFAHIPRVATEGFHFETSFVLLETN